MFPYSIFLVFQHSTDPKYPILLLAMMTKLDAYDDDINDCLFFRWTVYGAGKDHAVLNKRVECGGTELQGLCYGIPPPRGLQAGKSHTAQFAVCYNKRTLIPKFTGHVVKPNVLERNGNYEFHADSYFKSK